MNDRTQGGRRTSWAALLAFLALVLASPLAHAQSAAVIPAEDGIRCTPVDFGSAADGDWGPVVGREAQFTNRRSELHWVARSLLRRRELRIPAQWKEIWADLCAPSYWFDGRGRIAVESKDEIKARIKRSPDFSDAVLIALGAGGTKRPMIQ